MARFQEQLPYALTYIYNFYVASAKYSGDSRLIGHLWSLSLEEQFYIIWPLVILLTPKKHLKKLFLAAIVLGPVIRLVTIFIYRGQIFPSLSTNTPLAIYVLPFSHIDSFALGAYISRFEIPKPKLQLAILLPLVPLVGFATYYYSKGGFGVISSLGYPYPLANTMKQVWGYSLLAYLFALFIFAVVRQGLFTTILENKFVRYLGKISYGMYVYHFPIVWFVARIRDFGFGLTEETAKPLTALIAFSLTLLAVSACYHLLEKPILDLKDRFFPLYIRWIGENKTRRSGTRNFEIK